MFLAGYNFHVLDNAFVSHYGFATLKNRQKWRAQQIARNNERFVGFAQEVSLCKALLASTVIT